MAHTHEVKDLDNHYIIDPVTRNIENATGEKNSLVQYDHNSEIYTFEIPRYVEGHDMSLCNVVQIHYINIDTTKRSQKTGIYEANDLQIYGDDEDKVIFSWKVSRNSTQIYGILQFVIRYSCVDNGEVVYSWHTNIFKNITVLEGINNSEEIIEEYADVLEEWRQNLFYANRIEDSVTGKIYRIGVENGVVYVEEVT